MSLLSVCSYFFLLYNHMAPWVSSWLCSSKKSVEKRDSFAQKKKMSTLLHFEQMNREETIYPEDNHETFGFEHLRTPTWDFKMCLGKSLVFLSKQKNKITPSEYLCNYILKHLLVIATQKIQVEWKYAKVPAFVLGDGFTGA